ncbi:MAG: hypothetical protein NUV91_04235, partial [Candidatus Omnitrophica bacterium]|nr:hypothetical protein [Candidatus Omnitrophota bacterium]
MRKFLKAIILLLFLWRILVPLGVFAQESSTPEVPVDTSSLAFSGDIEILIKDGKWDEASSLLEKELLAKPFDPQLMALYTKVLALQRKWDLFFSVAEKTQALNSKDSKVQRNYEDSLSLAYDEGIALAREGQFEQGLDLLQKIESLGYAKDRWLVDQIVISVWQKKFEDAIVQYESLPPTVIASEYLLRAMIAPYRELGQQEKLLELYEKIFEYNPEDVAIRRAAFEAALTLKSFDLAHEYSQALSAIEA